MNYLFYLIVISNILTACTIGITRDSEGNAILWKNRDLALRSPEIDRRIKSDVNFYNSTDSTISHFSVNSRNSNDIFMGMNSSGFGIVNSIVVPDIEGRNTRDITNEKELFKNALENCYTISDFQSIIDSLQIDSTNSILSNFAVVDSNGFGAIYEINTSDTIQCNNLATYSGLHYCKQEFSENMDFLIRTNHFKLTDNPTDDDLDLLNSYDCSEHNDYEDGVLLSNKVRYCATENYLQSNLDTEKIIETLISTNPDLGRPGLLRSLNKSYIDSDGYIEFYLDENDYDYTYFYQQSYECAIGRPAGYALSKYSISRAETVSSVVIKSVKNDPTNSVMFAALGNPLITPYIPFKVLDYDDNILTDASSLSDSSIIIRQEVFDYDTHENYENHPYKRWVDTQHLKQYTGSYNDYSTNHDGIFNELFELESEFINFEEDNLNTEQSIGDIINECQNYFSEYIEGFNNNYDEPRYDIGHVEVNEYCQDDFSSYVGRRIYDRTLHRNHDEVNEWKIINPSTGALFEFSNSNYLNPLITASDWETFDDSVDVNLYINEELKDTRSFYVGCGSNFIDNDSCETGDLNTDGVFNVSDIVILVEIILNGFLGENATNSELHLGDIYPDGQINVIDIVTLVDIIIDQEY